MGGQGATEWPVSLPNGHGQSRRRLKSSGFGLPLLLCQHFHESRHRSLALPQRVIAHRCLRVSQSLRPRPRDQALEHLIWITRGSDHSNQHLTPHRARQVSAALALRGFIAVLSIFSKEPAKLTLPFMSVDIVRRRSSLKSSFMQTPPRGAREVLSRLDLILIQVCGRTAKTRSG